MTTTRELVSILDTAADETEAALEELRELAHGIYPAILTEAGLGPALETLADEAPLPVELGDLPPERAPLARRADRVRRRGRGHRRCRGAGSGMAPSRRPRGAPAAWSWTSRTTARPRRAGLVHLLDRVGALGGTLDAGDNTLRAEIPCE